MSRDTLPKVRNEDNKGEDWKTQRTKDFLIRRETETKHCRRHSSSVATIISCTQPGENKKLTEQETQATTKEPRNCISRDK
jgi:hypothetical protein